MLKQKITEILIANYGGVPSPIECASNVADQILEEVLEWIIPYQMDALVKAIKKLQE